MQTGQQVYLYWPDEQAKLRATVEAIDPKKVGKSNAKILDLRYKEPDSGKEMIAQSVHHMADAVEGEPFWALKGEKVGKDWADVEITDETPAPALVAVAELESEDEGHARTASRKGKNKPK